LHLGKTTHVWDIKIYDDKDRLFCAGRLTVAILSIKK
jgi:1,4-dihydroxy-2-naphthoyl-CoA hydrolase